MSDRLEQLLRETDVALAAPPLNPELAEVAQRKGRRRQRIRIVAASTAPLLLLAGITVYILRPHHRASPVANVTPADQVQRTKEQIAELNRQAEWHDRLARRIAAHERRHPDPNRLLAGLDPARLNRDLDEAAFALVYQADRLARQPELQPAAADFYRQVASDFPDSTWAPIARERLARLIDRKEG
jgi:hypothetical protein